LIDIPAEYGGIVDSVVDTEEVEAVAFVPVCAVDEVEDVPAVVHPDNTIMAVNILQNNINIKYFIMLSSVIYERFLFEWYISDT
jgi:hypothetical protein